MMAHEDDVLVIRAACARGVEGASAWAELHVKYGWELLPHSLARFLPMIYLNVRAEPLVPDRDRLRGVYRASWASNLTWIGVARPVLEGLRVRGVEPIVIKGGALCILTGRWGFRRMGDLDVVLPSMSAPAVRDLLQCSGFTRITPPVAGVHSDVEGPWEGPGDSSWTCTSGIAGPDTWDCRRRRPCCVSHRDSSGGSLALRLRSQLRSNMARWVRVQGIGCRRLSTSMCYRTWSRWSALSRFSISSI